MLKYAPRTPPKYAPRPLSQFIAHPASYSAPRPPKRECLFVSTGGSTMRASSNMKIVVRFAYSTLATKVEQP